MMSSTPFLLLCGLLAVICAQSFENPKEFLKKLTKESLVELGYQGDAGNVGDVLAFLHNGDNYNKVAVRVFEKARALGFPPLKQLTREAVQELGFQGDMNDSGAVLQFITHGDNYTKVAVKVYEKARLLTTTATTKTDHFKSRLSKKIQDRGFNGPLETVDDFLNAI